MPKISVIVPVYNAEKFIVQCIESILNQSFNDLELILVNDGSPDNCGVICDEYAVRDSRVKAFHQENGGVCSARNTGLDNAEGEYVFFVDSDDYIHPDTLEILYNDLSAGDAHIAIGFMESDTSPVKMDNKTEVWKGKQGLIKGLEDNPALYGCCNKLFKRDLIEDIRFVVGRKVHEDGYFNFLALIKLPTIVVRNKCTYVYRNNPDSASHAKFSDKFFDVLYFEELKRNTINELFPELSEKTYNKLVKAHITMLRLFCNTKDKKYKKDIKNSIQMIRRYSKYFIPINSGEKKFFLIVKYGGYHIFRGLYQFKHREDFK